MKDLNNINDWNDVTEHQKIGEILMQSGKLSLVDLGIALDIQRIKPIQLGTIFLNMKVITLDDLNNALEIQSLIDERLNENQKD